MQATFTDDIDAINQAITERIGAQKYRVWFKNSTRFSIADDYLKVGVPNHFVGDALIKSVTLLASSLGIDAVAENIGEAPQTSVSVTDRLGPVCLQSKAMKVSEATFYLRCHKRK